MRPLGLLLCSAGLVGLAVAPARAADTLDHDGWQRVDSQYCTLWFDPAVTPEQVNRRVSVWWIRPQVSAPRGASLEEQIGAKCDTIFKRVEEVLDMHPPGVHVTVLVARTQSQISHVHQARYGQSTDSDAFYIFENNTIYASYPELSESVLAHEMAHSIIDHYFGTRPPRKIEEMLAIYADENLRN